MIDAKKSWLLLLLAAPALRAQPDYFPIQTGNVWVYRARGETLTLEVGEPRAFGEQYYFRLSATHRGDAWVRTTGDGALVAFDEKEGREKLWAPFGAPEGHTYTTAIDPCNQQATIESRSARFTGPVGQFDNALHIVYGPPSCADAGIVEEYYLPYVGLVRRVETTIAGPRAFDLVYTRMGNGITVISAGETGFGLSVDRSVYTANLMPPVDLRTSIPEVLARISLRHSGPDPLRLVFSSGQTFELLLRNERGDIVYRWSEGMAFTQAIRTVEFPPGEKNWVVAVRLADKAGAPLPEGSYTAEAWLATAGNRRYLASVGFEFKHLY